MGYDMTLFFSFFGGSYPISCIICMYVRYIDDMHDELKVEGARCKEREREEGSLSGCYFCGA